MADLCAKFRILLRKIFLLRILLLFFKFIFLIVPVLLSVAFITLLERKVLSLVGLRLGPVKVSIYGLFQPIGDALKLMNKQSNVISNFNFFFYYLSSFFMFFRTLILWNSAFFDPSSFSFKYSILILFVILAFNSFNSIISG